MFTHHTIKSGYTLFVDPLNRFPQGVPPSGRLDKILAMLFSETEARLNKDICLGYGPGGDSETSPIKQLTARQQVKSRYLETLISTMERFDLI